MTTEDKAIFLKDTFTALNLSLTDNEINQFLKYYDLLIDWNNRMNLTAITEYEDVVRKHFADSLAIVQSGKITGKEKIIDIGTGAGFPGIPLKIMYPELEITLLDSLNKRIKFLNEVITRLELTKITAIHGRAEEYARQKGIRESFDLAVSRAVANLSTLSEYCIPYVRKGGAFIAYKSGNIQEESINAKKAIAKLGGKQEDVILFNLPGTGDPRSLVIVEKIANCPGKYPRRNGLPSKEPL